MEKEKTKLTLEMHGRTISVEFDYLDVDLEALYEAWKGLLVSATFSEKTIEKFITDKAEELK